MDELVDGHQLDRGDTEIDQMLDRGRVGQARVGAPELVGHVRMQLREALDVGLVDDRVGERRQGMGVVAPVEVVCRDHT